MAYLRILMMPRGFPSPRDRRNADLPKLLDQDLQVVDQLPSPCGVPVGVGRFVPRPADQNRLSKLLQGDLVVARREKPVIREVRYLSHHGLPIDIIV